MTRKKVKLAWIVNDTARKASLKKRRVGLLKKVSELTTLCGVNAFVIIYSPDDSEPIVWPSRSVVQRLLTRFQNMSDIERCKKMMNQESYLKERIGKVQEQNRKHQRRSRDLEMTYLMLQFYQEKGFDNFELSELHSLYWLVEEKMKEIRKRVEYFEQVPPLPPCSFLSQGPKMDGIGQAGGGIESRDGRHNHTNVNPILGDQWFIDLMNNNENNIAGSSSTKNDMGLPHLYNIGGNFGSGVDMSFHHRNIGDNINGGHNFDLRLTPSNMGGDNSRNNFDLGLPHDNIGGINNISNVDLGLTHGNTGRDVLGVGLPYSNTGGSNIGGNAFHGLGLPYDNIGGNTFPRLELPRHGNIGGNSTGGNDIGLPNFFWKCK